MTSSAKLIFATIKKGVRKNNKSQAKGIKITIVFHFDCNLSALKLM
jgi:hypothetical protein